MSATSEETRIVHINGKNNLFEIDITLLRESGRQAQEKPAGSLHHLTRGWSVVLDGTLAELFQLRDLIDEVLQEANSRGITIESEGKS